MHMKTGVEQCVYAIFLLSMLPDKAVLPGEAISQQLGTSPTYFQKLLRKLVSADLITSVPGVKGGFKLKKKNRRYPYLRYLHRHRGAAVPLFLQRHFPGYAGTAGRSRSVLPSGQFDGRSRIRLEDRASAGDGSIHL